jgi:hypothetical protein
MNQLWEPEFLPPFGDGVEECGGRPKILVEVENPQWPAIGNSRKLWMEVFFSYVPESFQAQLAEWASVLAEAGVQFQILGDTILLTSVLVDGVPAPVTQVGFSAPGSSPWVLEVGEPRESPSLWSRSQIRLEEAAAERQSSDNRASAHGEHSAQRDMMDDHPDDSPHHRERSRHPATPSPRIDEPRD